MSTLTEIVETDENSELRTLSEGLKKLEEDCDFIVPDTSFIRGGIFSNPYLEKSDPQKRYGGNKGVHNLFSLISFYDDIVTGSPSPDPEKVHEGIGDALSISDMEFRILLDILRRDRLRLPSQVYEELIQQSRSLKRSLKEFKRIFKVIMRKGYTSKMITTNQRNAYRFAEQRKKFFRGVYAEHVRNFLVNVQYSIGNISTLADFIEGRDAIVEDTGLFEDPDERIIDGALELRGSVGIISCDSDFYEKTRSVLRIRKEKGLENPNLVLVVSSQNLKDYKLMEYQS